MRDRLIEILEKTIAIKDENTDDYIEWLADELLESGVIVLPCKVGQTVFHIVKLYGDRTPLIVEGEVFEIALTHENGEVKNRFYFWEKGGNRIINHYSLWLEFGEVGKTVFLSKEEAEQALGKLQAN